MSTEFEGEPIPGLPGELPAGEELLWQGRPRWQVMARRTFYTSWVALYLGTLVVARGVTALRSGEGVGAALGATFTVALASAGCLAMLYLLAILHARATVYTITSRRVVMRFGVALPMAFNLPFKRIGAAELKELSDGSGDIALALSGKGRIAYLHLWPHARPWRFSPAQPMLRSIPDAGRVARLLGDAVKRWAANPGAAPVVESRTDDHAAPGNVNVIRVASALPSPGH